MPSARFDTAINLCQSPPYWHTALAQLIAVALRNRDKGLAKIKQLVVTEFHSEVIAGMENRLGSISTIVRMGPLLGLVGTVASMIAAFSRIGGSEKADPHALATDISLALWATGAGLLIANPMMLIGNDVHARLRRLRDRTERQLQDVLEILEPKQVMRGLAAAMLFRRDADEERNEHIDMTPMVDVVFQLMTFMLFSVQMTGGEKVDVPPARHGVGVEESAATFLTLTKPAGPGGETRLLLGHGEGAAATLEQARQAVADGVKEGRRKVILQADGDVPHGEIVKVAGAVAQVEGITVHVGVQEPAGK